MFDEEVAISIFRGTHRKLRIALVSELTKSRENSIIFLFIQEGIMTYNGKKWTTSADNLLKLYELGMVNISLTPFSIQDDKTLVTDINTITPTLSPKDPAFPAWWEAHKGEWEQ